MKHVTFEVRRGWSLCLERGKDGLWRLDDMCGLHEPEKHMEVFAHVGSVLVGYLGLRDRTAHPYHVHSRGTWVADAVRGCGIGTQLWSLALDETKARKVSIFVVSDEGLTLVDGLRKRFPAVIWNVQLDGEGLRNLKSLN